MYYVCSNCGKMNFIEGENSTFVINKCKFCGFDGKMNLGILKESGDFEGYNI